MQWWRDQRLFPLMIIVEMGIDDAFDLDCPLGVDSVSCLPLAISDMTVRIDRRKGPGGISIRLLAGLEYLDSGSPCASDER